MKSLERGLNVIVTGRHEGTVAIVHRCVSLCGVLSFEISLLVGGGIT